MQRDYFHGFQDLYHHIFQNLNVYDLCRAASVCKRWNLELSSDKLWKPAYHFRFDHNILCVTSWDLPKQLKTWRDYYRDRVLYICILCLYPTRELWKLVMEPNVFMCSGCQNNENKKKISLNTIKNKFHLEEKDLQNFAIIPGRSNTTVYHLQDIVHAVVIKYGSVRSFLKVFPLVPITILVPPNIVHSIDWLKYAIEQYNVRREKIQNEVQIELRGLHLNKQYIPKASVQHF